MTEYIFFVHNVFEGKQLQESAQNNIYISSQNLQNVITNEADIFQSVLSLI